jgi:DNA invertase Pin-like site-specific DNA recombinase
MNTRRRPRPTIGRAVIYTRLSLDKHGDGLAVERQLADSRALCERNGWEVVAEHSDNSISASTGVRRPGWEQVLGALTDGTANALVGYAPDRFLRRPADLEVLLDVVEARSVRVATVMAGDYDLTTPGGRAMARTMTVFARMETEVKSERQRAQEWQRAESGKPRVSVRPFGYQADGTTVHAVEGPALADAIRRVTVGASQKAIMREWTEAGLLPVRGGQWYASSFRALLIRPRNAGLSEYRGEILGAGQWDPLVTVEEREALLAVLNAPGRRQSRPARRWLLPSIAVCGSCGGRLKVGGVTIRGDKRSLYKCTGCGHVHRSATRIDAMVEELMRKRLARKDAARLMAPRVETAPLLAQVAALRARIEQTETDYADGLIDARQLHTVTARIESQIVQAQSSLAAATQAAVVLPDAANGWDALDINDKRALLRAMLDVKVYPRSDEPEDCGPYGCVITWR